MAMTRIWAYTGNVSRGTTIGKYNKRKKQEKRKGNVEKVTVDNDNEDAKEGRQQWGVYLL